MRIPAFNNVRAHISALSRGIRGAAASMRGLQVSHPFAGVPVVTSGINKPGSIFRFGRLSAIWPPTAHNTRSRPSKGRRRTRIVASVRRWHSRLCMAGRRMRWCRSGEAALLKVTVMVPAAMKETCLSSAFITGTTHNAQYNCQETVHSVHAVVKRKEMSTPYRP